MRAGRRTSSYQRRSSATENDAVADQRLHPQPFQNTQESTASKRRREGENAGEGRSKLTKGDVRNAAVMLSEAKHLGIGKVKVSEGDVRNWGDTTHRLRWDGKT